MTVERQTNLAEPPHHQGLRRFAARVMSIVVAINNFLESSSNFPMVGPEYKDPTKKE